MSDLEKLEPELDTLARKTAEAFRGMVEFYSRPEKAMGLGMSREDALEKAEEPWPEAKERVLQGEPDQISWWELGNLAEEDPEAALQGWERIKRTAADELSTGHRAAAAAEMGLADPWQRAQFLAVRNAILAEFGPMGGAELLLIDNLAHAQTGYLWWLRELLAYSQLEHLHAIERDRFVPPTLNRAQSVQHAAAMVERFNQLFLRNLRALNDLRRRAPAVTIQHAGQVNLGAQQVNLSLDCQTLGEGDDGARAGHASKRRTSRLRRSPAPLETAPGRA